jgi:Domain of unknown function (DUF4795)
MKFNSSFLHKNSFSHEVPEINLNARIDSFQEEIGKLKTDYVMLQKEFERKLKEHAENYNQKCLVNMSALEQNLDKVREEMKNVINSTFDTEEFNKILAAKADNEIMYTFLPKEVYETEKSDINNNVLEIISHLAEREIDWQKRFIEMSQLLDSKLNKIEMKSLQETLSEQFQQLQESVKALQNSHHSDEAAGTRYQLVKGVKCISCNSNAVMKVVNNYSESTDAKVLNEFPPSVCLSLLNGKILKTKYIKRAHTAKEKSLRLYNTFDKKPALSSTSVSQTL